jgi:hypothetical protein
VHARKRGVESFGKREKMSREVKNKEKSMCMEKKEKYVYERMKERRKREKRSGNKDMRGMNQVKEKK